eukprot:gene8558-14559_t
MASREDDVRKPKPKKNSKNIQRDAPFPVPIATLTGKPANPSRWYHYFGTLKGDSVVVSGLGDMTFLYKMGFFGKGNLSQSEPQFNKFHNTFDDRSKKQMIRSGKGKCKCRQHKEWSSEEKSMEEEVPEKQAKLEDLYQVDEFLQLSLEEAYFLAFGLGCLTVKDEDEKELPLVEMWRKFCHLKARFLETYAAYHYFRSLGWVVRDGLIYGSDFLLYKDGMPYYHSSYAVLAYLVDDDKVGASLESLPWTWSYLTCMNRVAERVAKEVLIAFVVKPKGLKTGSGYRLGIDTCHWRSSYAKLYVKRCKTFVTEHEKDEE